jgi:hypothetical protein
VQARYGGRDFPIDNLTVFGGFIQTLDAFPLQTELEIDLISDRLPESIEVTAVVAYADADGMGVEFSQFHRSGKQRLQELLSRLAGKS